MRAFFDKRLVHILLIAVSGFIAYSNSFDVAINFDDLVYIERNPVLKDAGYLFDPSGAAQAGAHKNITRSVSTRTVAYLTFWLNYQLHGDDVRGYHVFNLYVHLMNAGIVYFFIAILLRALHEGKAGGGSPPFGGVRADRVALFCSLLFVTHPVQTQAVTYISQRFTSLAALFYLLSVATYIRARLGSEQEARKGKGLSIPFYALSVCSAVLAMKTKEISFTLPVVIFLCEYAFFAGTVRKRALYLLPFFLSMSIVPLGLLDTGMPVAEALSDATRTTTSSRTEYFLTQGRVIITYIRLLFLPVNQTLDYDYPLYGSVTEPEVFVSLVLLSGLFCLSAYTLYRRKTGLWGRFAAFGVLWFFITLSVESSVMPLVDVIFEHRLYLPSVGAFVAVSAAVVVLFDYMRAASARGSLMAMVVLLPLVLCFAAYERNKVWATPEGLWSDAAGKAPGKIRPHIALAYNYYVEGNIDKAVEQLELVQSIEPGNRKAHVMFGEIYFSQGLLDKAEEHFRSSLRFKSVDAQALSRLGEILFSEGDIDKAINRYTVSLQLRPASFRTHVHLGIALRAKGLPKEAMHHFKAALDLAPDNVVAHYNLALAYDAKGLREKAALHLKEALRLKPGLAKKWRNASTEDNRRP